MSRPGWGTAAAIYNYIAGALSLLSGIGLIAASATAMDFMNQLLRVIGLQGGGAVLIIGIIGGVMYILVGVLEIMCAYGLWGLRNWARITAVVLHGVFALLSLVLVVLLLANGLSGTAIIQLFLFGINMMFIVGLILPSTAEAYAGLSGGQPIRMPRSGEPFEPFSKPTPVGAGLIVGPPSRTEVNTGARPGYSGGYAPSGGVAKTEVANAEPAVLAWLVERNGPRSGREHRLKQQVTIGRDAARCEVVLDDSKVSGEHARIRMAHGQFVLYDLASTNHTYVNDQEIQKQVLSDGDQIKIGPNVLLSFVHVSK
jgi:hypothetical protein